MGPETKLTGFSPVHMLEVGQEVSLNGENVTVSSLNTLENKPAEPAPAKEKMSRMEMGRLRSQYFTQRQGNVIACGHKFHPLNQPSSNCDDCWEAFFRVHTGLVSACLSIIKTMGERELVKARGTKFVKRFGKFAAKLAEEAKARQALIDNPTRIDNQPTAA